MEWIALRQYMGTAGVLFFIYCRIGENKKKRASFSSRETLLSHIKFLKNNQEKI